MGRLKSWWTCVLLNVFKNDSWLGNEFDQITDLQKDEAVKELVTLFNVILKILIWSLPGSEFIQI